MTHVKERWAQLPICPQLHHEHQGPQNTGQDGNAFWDNHPAVGFLNHRSGYTGGQRWTLVSPGNLFNLAIARFIVAEWEERIECRVLTEQVVNGYLI